MKICFFHLMPYRFLPEDFEQKYRSVWVDVPHHLFDAEKTQGLYQEFLDELEFAELFDADTGRSDVIVTFLALLELVRLKVIRARQDERFGAIRLVLGVDSLEEAAERARDLSQFDSWRGGGEGHGHADG